MNPAVQSLSHSTKYPTSWHLSGRDIKLAPLVVGYKVRWCDTFLAPCIPVVATRNLHFARQFPSAPYHTIRDI